MLDIPAAEWEIKQMLFKASGYTAKHPGLISALTSAQNKRSTKNAYILLVGLTGAGKSTTVNSLFDKQEIAPSGESSSCTSEIIEYRIPVPVPELGIKNSELRIIDTPGLADTRGLEQDSRCLATLEEFFDRHEEFKFKRIPNIVFVVAKFDDNRIDGENSSFVKMLKGLDMLLDKVSDRKYSNIVIVLTHLMNAKKQLREDPATKLQIFEKLVMDFTRFPKPIMITLAENDAEDRNLPMENGYYKLPNGEYFPHNIFEKLQSVSAACSDPIGEAIFRTAFKDPSKLKVINPVKKTPLVETTSPSAIRALSILTEANFKIDETEVSQLLDKAWWTLVPEQTRASYPVSLQFLQRALQLRCIRTEDQVPRTPKDVLNLLQDVPRNEAIMMMLTKGLSVTVPPLSVSTIGRCYHLTRDQVFAQTILREGELITSHIGFAIPNNIKCDLSRDTVQICKVFSSKTEYIQNRLSDLNTQGTVNPENYTMYSQHGYNLVDSSTPASFSCVQETRTFSLTLKDDTEITDGFKEKVESLPFYNEQDYDNVESWKRFFDQYGTHVVYSAFGGGSITVTVRGEEAKKLIEGSCDEEKLKFLKELVEFATNIEFRKNIGGEIDAEQLSYDLQFKGGDIIYHRTDLSSINPQDAANTLREWKESISTEPAMLQSSMRLVPLSFFVRKVNTEAADRIEFAMSKLFQSQLEYKAPPPPPPPAPRPAIQSPGKKKSCLKQGTLILMEDRSLKPIEDVQPGDSILDKDLNRCTVLAKNHFFLGDRKFYGFDKDMECFFTGEHIFVGSDGQLLVNNVKNLFAENPLMEKLRVEEMKGRFEILMIDDSLSVVGENEVELVEEVEIRDPETPVYFLEVVGSPSGTYFANGYVCRHELPPFEYWPRTIGCLINIIAPMVHRVLEMGPLTLKMMDELYELAKITAGMIEDGFLNDKFLLRDSAIELREEGTEVLSLPVVVLPTGEDYPRYLSLILQSNTFAAFGMLMYAKCGKIIAKRLDPSEDISDGNTTQHDISKIVEATISFLVQAM